ncbi:hypothetical protein [Streptomyces sp. CC77]|uniref:LppU/SCO3897 family protein n=1 Tax=Streptomyces sp. CC77 TaxID=1906739 RepID=UPI0008DCE8AB|nr:hypothetical protein [Streptomyces sp. CC77]OII67648.1 hypothetical protein BJP39_24270 [Streptomyces sp. CC77]
MASRQGRDGGRATMKRIAVCRAAALITLLFLSGCTVADDVEVGDCMADEGGAAHIDPVPVDCDSDRASLRVVDVVDGQSDCLGLYLAYQETNVFGSTTTLCLSFRLFSWQ